jgi:hypothetical protein
MLMAEGVEAPKEIVKEVKERWGMGMSIAQASTYKGSIKREKAAAEGGSKPGPAPRPRKAKAPPAQGAGFSNEDITTLAGLARRAGGISRLQELLDALKQVQ